MRSLFVWSLFVLWYMPGQPFTLGKPASTAESQASPASFSNIYQGFVGDWTGVLEYRDYQSDERIKLPTWLTVKLAEDGSGLDFTYIYDDGPNKIVKEQSRFAIDPQHNTFTVTSNRDNSQDVYQLSGLDSFATTGRGTLQLTGSGTENGHKVDVRITIKLGRNSYSFQKETHQAGADFLFRDGYTFVRRNPPPAN